MAANLERESPLAMVRLPDGGRRFVACTYSVVEEEVPFFDALILRRRHIVELDSRVDLPTGAFVEDVFLPNTSEATDM